MRIYFYLRKFNLCRGAFEFFPEAVDTTSMTVRVRCRRRSVLNTTAVLQKRVVDRDHNAVADLDLDRGSNRTLKSPERGRGTSFPLEGLLEGFQILQSGGSLRRVRRISPPPPPTMATDIDCASCGSVRRRRLCALQLLVTAGHVSRRTRESV